MVAKEQRLQQRDVHLYCTIYDRFLFLGGNWEKWAPVGCRERGLSTCGVSQTQVEDDRVLSVSGYRGAKGPPWAVPVDAGVGLQGASHGHLRRLGWEDDL